MRHRFAASLLLALLAVPACGSDDDGGSSTGSGGGNGSGGSQGTTCSDGYPKVGTACAIAFEKCSSCGTGSWECCDVFECQAGSWAQTQFHTLCPSDGGADADAEGEGGDPDASDAAPE